MLNKRNILFLLLMYLLMQFALMDLRELIEFFQFDVNAPDLTADGTMLRNKYFSSYYDPAIMYATIIKYQFLLLPLIIFISLYYYNKIKSKSLKYVIGKSENINKYLMNLKFKIMVLPVVFFFTVELIYTAVSWYLTGLRVRKGANFEYFFPDNTVLHFLDNSLGGYYIALAVFATLYIAMTMFVLTEIIDYGYSYIYVGIAYCIIMYIVNDFVIAYVTYLLAPATSYFMLMRGILSNIELVISFVYLVAIYLFFKLTHRKEY